VWGEETLTAEHAEDFCRDRGEKPYVGRKALNRKGRKEGREEMKTQNGLGFLPSANLVGEDSFGAVGTFEGYGVLRLRSARPHFAQDDKLL